MKNGISPFYFPTTVVFIDDSRDFLANVALQLDGRIAFRLFESPIDALVMTNGSYDAAPLNARYFSPYRYPEEFSLSHHVIDLDLDKIRREVNNACRFRKASVAVVDYDMPEMDGLEVCANIKNPAMKKILLTGKADEKLAVRAFNEGIIDRFIMKQDIDAIPMLNRAIGDLQAAYFRELESMLVDALAVGSHSFLRDPLFARQFKLITERLGVVEHYLCTSPEGILMLDADATPYLLVVQTEEHLKACHEIACDQGAPDELLAALRSNEWIPYFWDSEANYSGHCENWRACLHPAEAFKGREWYLYSVIKNPRGFNLDSVVSYNEFLEQLDLNRCS